MRKIIAMAKKILAKHGTTIAACAFAFAAISANSSCVYPFYEPQEPAGLDRFKKFSR